MSASIFISFAAPDRKVASTLCKALESRGFQCWFSSRDILPGENFQVAIVRAIRKAKILLLVFTANSNSSEEMTKELALASQERLIVVPLRVEDVAPNDAFAYEFATRQWIDFFADWEAAIDQLSERLAQALPAGAQLEAAAPAKSQRSGRAEELAPAPTLKAPEPPEPAAATPLAPPPAPPKAVAPKPLKPAPKPAPAEAPELVRDSIGAEAPMAAAAKVAEPAAAPKSRAGMLAVAAVVLVALIGLGLAAPALFGKKPQPPAGLAAAAVTASPEPAIPAAPVAEAVPVAPEAAEAEAEPEPVKAAPKPKRKAAPKPQVDDVPY